LKEVVEAVNNRIKSPYFGYSILAFLTWNWKALFLFATSKADPPLRIAAFEEQTNYFSLFVGPLLVGVLVAAATYWIKLGFELVARKPLGRLDSLALEALHAKTIKQTELEQARSKLFAAKEEELIDRATRDAKVEQISDESTKENLSIQLEKLRRERDLLSKRESDIEINSESEVDNLEKLAQSHSNLSELNRQMNHYEEAKEHEKMVLHIREKITKLNSRKF
jgi:hypothetical protein